MRKPKDEIKHDVDITPEEPRDQDDHKMGEAEDLFLQILGYSSMKTRYERVVEAHRFKFDWVSHLSRMDNKSCTNFSDWLRHGQGIIGSMERRARANPCCCDFCTMTTAPWRTFCIGLPRTN
jgi:hypothetical protein